MRWFMRAVTALVGCVMAGSVWAWGDKPIKIVVAGPAGGTPDIIARIVGQQLSADLKQAVVVDNRPGAGGVIAMQAMLQAPPDGHTLLMGASTVLVEVPHVLKVPYDPLKDIVPVATLTRSGLVLVTSAAFPAQDFKGLLAELKKRTGKSSFASYSPGTASHYGGIMLNQRAGLDMAHVGFPGSRPALQQMMGGQIDMMFDGVAISLPLIKGGKLRAYAVTGAARSAQLPNLPTTAELGYPNIQLDGWVGLMGSAKLPSETLKQIQAAIQKAMLAPDIRQKLIDAGQEPSLNVNTPELSRELQQVSDRNAAIVKQFDIRLN